MMRKKLLLVCTSLTMALAGKALAMTSPAAQADAPVWLEIKVTNVESTPAEETSVQNIDATAEVLKAFKAPEGIKAGDSIHILYTYDPKPLYGPDGKRPIGPSSPPLLRDGRTTYAFLKAGETEGTYAPGAVAWSFAPPFGIPKETRDELGMKAPTPPSTPPPPPPNFQVPMKGPSAPSTKAPTTVPSSPPPVEQAVESGSSATE